MNIEMYDRVYNSLKAHLSDVFGEKYKSINIQMKVPNNVTKYPLVVISETSNIENAKTTNYEERIDTLRYEVEIYSTDLPVDGEMVSSVQICRDIQKEVDYVLGEKLRMERRGASPTPNVDTTIYRILMQYSAKVNIKRNILI